MLILQFWRVAFVKISPLMNIQIYICIKILHKNHRRKNSHTWKVLLHKFCENEVICCQNLWLFKMEVFWRNESNFQLNLLNPGNVVEHIYSKKTSQLQLLIIIYICYIVRVQNPDITIIRGSVIGPVKGSVMVSVIELVKGSVWGFVWGQSGSILTHLTQWLGIELPEQLNMKATLWCFGGSRLFGEKTTWSWKRCVSSYRGGRGREAPRLSALDATSVKVCTLPRKILIPFLDELNVYLL